MLWSTERAKNATEVLKNVIETIAFAIAGLWALSVYCYGEAPALEAQRVPLG